MYTYKYNCEYICTSNRLHLIEFCLCCFMDMQLYSNILSTMAAISLPIILEILPAFSSCSNTFHLSQSPSGLDGKTIVQIPGAEIVKPGYSSNFKSVLSRVDLLPLVFTSKFISFANSYNNFFSDNLARYRLLFLFLSFLKDPLSIRILYLYHEMLTNFYVE